MLELNSSPVENRGAPTNVGLRVNFRPPSQRNQHGMGIGLRGHDANNNVSRKLNFDINGKPNKVVLILAPCRSGSTALLNALAMVDSLSCVYQPIKAAVRRSLVGDRTPVILDAEETTLVLKETFGPYFLREVDYDPIKVLLEKGVAPEDLHVVALFRRPEECLVSWLNTFRRDDLNLPLLSASYRAVYDDCAKAQAQGVSVSSLRYESLADPQTFKSLLEAIGLDFDPAMLEWSLSKKFKLGAIAFDNLSQPGQDDVFKAVRRSSGLVVPPLSVVPAKIDADVAAKGGIESARAIYESVPSGTGGIAGWTPRRPLCHMNAPLSLSSSQR